MSPFREDMYRFCIHVLLGGHTPRVDRGADLGAEPARGQSDACLLFCETRERFARLLHGCGIVEFGNSGDLHCRNAHGTWFARRVQIAARKIDGFQAAAGIPDRLDLSVGGWVEMGTRMVLDPRRQSHRL